MTLARLVPPLVMVFLAASSAGCVAPSPGFTTCETRANCPAGLPCIAGVCQSDLEVDPCESGASCARIQTVDVDQLDLLFAVENAGGISEEQLSLVVEIPRLIRALTTGDRDGDGAQDFSPVRSLHVGVVSTDMGTGPVTGIVACAAGFGDDGVLINRGSTGTGCMATYPSRIFDFASGRDDPDTFSTAVGCVAVLGTAGCGFEHQLEAPLKALSLAPLADGSSPVSWTRPGYRPPVFLGSTFGHGGAGGANEGFLRPESVLAIVLMTEEEDCSASDPNIFDRTNPAYSSVDLNLRCHTFVDAQYPIQRYVDGFIGLRAAADRLVFAVIAGVPPTAVEDGLSYGAILELEQMTERIDPVLHNRLLPSCTSPGGRGIAFAPRRIVQVAQGLEQLGAETTVQSICTTSFAPAFDAITDRIADTVGASCFPRALTQDAVGQVDCDLYVLLPPIGGTSDVQHCADLPNADAYQLAHVRIDISGAVPTERELCQLRQVGSGGAGVSTGWFYDDGSSPASMLTPGCDQRISFSGAAQVTGAELFLVCDS